MYESEALVGNLAWSSNRILNMWEDSLRDKVRETLVGVSPLKVGGPLVLKLLLDIFMNGNDSALHSLTQILQTLLIKDVPDENISTIASYLKGAMLLLKNCTCLQQTR